jgi:hypothetical protein
MDQLLNNDLHGKKQVYKVPAVTWEPPATVDELLTRVYQDGATDSVRRFFAGEDLATWVDVNARWKVYDTLRSWVEAERQKAWDAERPLLDAIKQEGDYWGRAKISLELTLREISECGGDPVAHGRLEAAKLGHEARIRDLETNLARLNDQRAPHVRRPQDLRLLQDLANIILKGEDPGEGFEYLHLLPEPTRAAIERKRAEVETARLADEERRRRESEEAERVERERLAALETMGPLQLLGVVYDGLPPVTLVQGFSSALLTADQYRMLAPFRLDESDRVRFAAIERLIAVGADLLRAQGVEPPHIPTRADIAAQREREQQEALERELARIEQMLPNQVIEAANAAGLVMPAWWPSKIFNDRSDAAIHDFTKFYNDKLQVETHPIRRRLCERMIWAITGTRPSSMASSGFPAS